MPVRFAHRIGQKYSFEALWPLDIAGTNEYWDSWRANAPVRAQD